MHQAIVVMLMILIINETSGYYNYSVDCEDECIMESLPCTISMINFHDFPCECMHTSELCLSLASDTKACLLEDGTVKGGSKIWDAYNHWAHPNSTTTTTPKPNPTTTTPKPNPTPSGEPSFYKLWAFGVTSSILSVACYFAASAVCQRVRTWYYQPIPETPTDEQPSSVPSTIVVSGERSPDSPYGATTQNR